MNKKSLSEQDICTKFITPAIEAAGWDLMDQVRQQVHFTKGKVIVRGQLTKRGKSNFADYILYYKSNVPIAVIEAKDNNHPVGGGMEQALRYAEALDLPFVFSSNGDAFLFHDRTVSQGKVETELPINGLPSPGDLWDRYRRWKGISPEIEEIISQEYHADSLGKEPRYYQRIAINRTVEAIAKGQDRILLVMATGTGKTYVAFQIIWRLWKAGAKKRVLFLADRNVLADQAKNNDFKPFGSVMTKIKKRTVDTSYEIYLALYQAVSGTEDIQNIYKEFSPGFFDLIVIDECHRGSAAEDAAWREILEYFNRATQIGLTATPKETRYVSNIHYFGDPIYTYSLKQGIEDGFLAPYKVVRIDLDKDLAGWRPEKGKVDKQGQAIEDRIYNLKDFDRTLVLEKRTELVAKKVSEFLKETDRFAKTIVFCEDIDHAERMRQALVNENSDVVSENSKYIARITGDSRTADEDLDSFIDPEKRYPVIATTSKLMTTGVDAQTCKLIVLDQGISSLTEFKQIIGRGTRINEDYNKLFFTIMDFRRVTELFADPSFDGAPVQIYEPGAEDSVVPPESGDLSEEAQLEGIEPGEFPEPDEIPDISINDNAGSSKGTKYIVNDVPVWVVGERVQYYAQDGKLTTESLKEFSKKAIRKEFATLNDFLRKWKSVDRKEAIIQELEEEGVIFEALETEVGRDYSPFDLICHIAYGQPPLTKRERAENVKKRNYFAKYGEKARAVIEALLQKYADDPVRDISDPKILKVKPLDSFGTPIEIVKIFGGKENYEKVLRELEEELYRAA